MSRELSTLEKTAGSPPPRRAAPSGPSGIVDVLTADRDLAAAVEASPTAPRSLPTVAIAVPIGPWTPPPEARADVLGLLVLSGLAIRRTVCGGARGVELIGPSDLLRPWLGEAEGVIVARSEWEVVEPMRLALLNGSAVRLCAECPPMLAELLDRALVRSRRQALQTAIVAATNRIEDRVLLLFAQLAERWGRVNRAGILLMLPLTHSLIAELAGARRPTVTTALSELRHSGALERCRDGWLLTNRGRTRIAELAAPGGGT
jgi:hypothetical protein